VSRRESEGQAAGQIFSLSKCVSARSETVSFDHLRGPVFAGMSKHKQRDCVYDVLASISTIDLAAVCRLS
jgi:hypothetical protein